jgi:glycosyltransferase involved in cell wall biosynthesis
MSVKRVGIYVTFRPALDLRAQGLGRQLAGFLRGSAERSDLQFVIACPSWGREQIEVLCKAEDVQLDHIEFVAPSGLPFSVRMYNAYLEWRGRKRKRRFRAFIGRLRPKLKFLRNALERRLVSTRNPITAIGILLALVLTGLIFGLFVAIESVLLAIWGGIRKLVRKALSRPFLAKVRSRLPEKTAFHLRLFQQLEQTEADRLISMINRRRDIAGWYCPTAFWPDFNRIRAPRLMCVPDMVLSEFPVNFGILGGKPVQTVFDNVRRAVRNADHCVTYSEQVKWGTVVKRFNMAPAAIHVVRHASQDLSQFIQISGTSDDFAATETFCWHQFLLSLRRMSFPSYTGSFLSRGIRFIFYPSQLRPNKNVLTLLRAYKWLLRDRYLGLKLVLTGTPSRSPQIVEFVKAERLLHDVAFLPNLSLQELAACYRVARLAVNPSLSEGGFPFTFTEALSVGTPVVMARIPVTEEIVTDPDLQEKMLFDSSDWKDMATRIEWALENRATLLSSQKALYELLAKRTWRHVVDDHIEILDRVTAQRAVTTST